MLPISRRLACWLVNIHRREHARGRKAAASCRTPFVEKRRTQYATNQVVVPLAMIAGLAVLARAQSPKLVGLPGRTRRAEDARRWQALRPPPGSPPQAFVTYDLRYLADHPDDARTYRNLASAEARLGDYGGAIRADRHALQLNPHDRAAESHLALVLSWAHQYDAAIEVYHKLLASTPADPALLGALARVELWAGRPERALLIYKQLFEMNPSDEPLGATVARLELGLKQDDAARATLGACLRLRPRDSAALLLRAQLDKREGKLYRALDDYNSVLGENFEDVSALYGAAEIDYYVGRPNDAYPLAFRLVVERPGDIDALLLLARINRARGKRKSALALVRQAEQLSPSSSEARELAKQIQEESAITLTTRASYERETSVPGGGRPLLEDLNAYGGDVRIGFSALPKTRSFLMLSSTPSNSPAGGIQGAVAPAELLYGQTTAISNRFDVRAGAGGVRLGPGVLFPNIYLGSPTRSPAFTLAAFAGASWLPAPKLRLDFVLAREPILYTPTSVRYGAVQRVAELEVGYNFDPRTRLRASFFHESDSSAVHDQVVLPEGGAIALEANGHDSGDGAGIDIARNLIRAEHAALDLGYSGVVFGYAGERRGVYMGFFNPKLYQRHFITSRLHGKLAGPVAYTLVADFGVQQADEGRPFTRAIQAGPALTFRLSRGHAITVGYVHYNFAQALGAVTGNAVQLSSRWRF